MRNEDIEEVIEEIQSIKEKYNEAIENDIKVNKLFHELIYYYRDLLTMGYNMHNISDIDLFQINQLKRQIEIETQNYQQGTIYTLNEQIDFISNMDLSEEDKEYFIQKLYEKVNTNKDKQYKKEL